MEKNIPLLKGEEVAVGYKKGKNIRWVAKEISFSLRAGQLTCLLGPNGVGKSTLIKAILGQNLPIQGQILYKGKPIQQFNAKTLARKMSVVLTDRISPGNLTVRQLVGLGRIPFTSWLGTLAEEDRKAVDLAIQATKIGYLTENKVAEISDGQLQKVMIARALAQDGELMILDEPTAHLDLVNRLEIMQLLREIAHSQQKAVLVVTHDLHIATETADEFWLMPCGGPLLHGTPEDLILSGQINQLLPTDRLHFDASTGKIQDSELITYDHLQGPEEVLQWLRLAMRKNNISNDHKVRITAENHPVSFVVEKEGVQERMATVQQVIHRLRSWK